MDDRKRKKTWDKKVKLAQNSFVRAKKWVGFPDTFYRNLFFLNPNLKEYFKETEWEKQHIALLKALDHLFNFLDDKDSYHRNHIQRIGETHSKKNMDIHPHDYYYWIEALVMTLKEFDDRWHHDNEYYIRECLFYPISFIITLYNKD